MREQMGFTGIGANPDSHIKTLSGGEKQGVAIGRAMYFDADLVILDEPTMALSLQEVEIIIDKTKIMTFMLMSVLASFAGILDIFRMRTYRT